MNNDQMQEMMGIYKIRLLQEIEAALYRSIRLEAIQKEPAMFRCSSPAEADLTDEQWEERIKHPRAVFGLFEHDRLIGMTSIILTNDQEGYLGQSYIKKEYRGLGLSTLLYKIRMTWASKLQLKRLTVSHRESNVISKAANQRSGFKYSYRESVNWLDGTTEDVLYYTLEL
uniref:GNAT family N-acetyltransferase n=1 Tax=Pedobacter schmidteae TaxID=2201271 RepID=UPI000EB26082|nr:GNAT family N-acetyltransferase [Pedobacter schmidteae]